MIARSESGFGLDFFGFDQFSPLFFPYDDEDLPSAAVGASDFFASLSPEEQEFVVTAPAASSVFPRPGPMMKLVSDGPGWRIEGAGKDRARVAYAHLVDGQLKYSFDSALLPRSQVETNARDVHSKGISGLQRSPNSVTTN